MPKKIHSNPKADAARERKEEVKKAKKSAAEIAAENAKWSDEGTTAAEKRKAEKAAREAEEAKKRAEKRALQQKEEEAAAAISGKAKGMSNAEKKTRAQLLKQAEEVEEQRRLEAEARRMAALKLAAPVELTPNPNRARGEQEAQDVAQYGAGNVISASGIDDALGAVAGGALKSSGPSASAAAAAIGVLDSHPEKRMKSAYAEYEERMMPEVRQENPHLKLSQYKEMIFKSWQKAPENPRNMRAAAEQALLQQSDAWKYGHAGQ